MSWDISDSFQLKTAYCGLPLARVSLIYSGENPAESLTPGLFSETTNTMDLRFASGRT